MIEFKIMTCSKNNLPKNTTNNYENMCRRRFNRYLLQFLFASIIGLSPQLSFSEQAEASKTSPSESEEPTQPEVIIVSASRQEQQLSEASVSVTAISSDTNQEIAPTHPNELLSAAPGTWISRGNGQEHLTAIRSPVFVGAGSCGSFLITEDMIPVRAVGFCNSNQLFDTFYETASRAEVIRGPHSSLYGSNAMFGGIHFFTPNGIQQNYLRLGADSQSKSNVQWLLKDSQLSTFGSILNDNGWRASSGVEQQKIGLAYETNNDQNFESRTVFQLNNMSQETAGFIEGFDAFRNETLNESNPVPDAYRDVFSFRLHSRLRWQDGDQAWQVTPYLRHHEMEFLMHFVPWQPVEENGHDSVGVQTQWALSHSNNGKWLIGTDVELTSAFLKETQDDEAPFAQDRYPVGAHYDYQVEAQNAAAYVNWTALFAERWDAELGARIDSNRFDYDNRISNGWDCAEGVQGCRFYRPEDQTDSFVSPSFSSSIGYRVSDALSIYGSWNRAFRVPQAAELYRLQSDTQPQLDDVSIVAFELGLRWASDNVQAHAAVFDMRQEDGIYLDDERRFVSGADSSHKGLEYQLEWAPLSSLEAELKISLGGTIAQHRYENNPGGESDDIIDNEYDTAPKNIHHARVSWQPSSRVKLFAIANYLDEYFVEPSNEHRYGGHTLVDLGTVFELSDKTSLQLNIKNITDREYAERADYAFGEYRYFPGLPRRFQVSVKWNL